MTVRGVGPGGDLRFEVYERGRARTRLYVWRARTLRRRGRMAEPDYDPAQLAVVVPFPAGGRRRRPVWSRQPAGPSAA